jgi:fibronectin-binding autotransporter adhesin
VDSGASLSYRIVGQTPDGSGETVLTGSYGTLTVHSNGSYSYAPNAAAINALTTSTTDVFNVQVSDGTATTTSALTVNLAGANDAPTVSVGTPSATIVEAGGVGNGTPGTPAATITVTKADVDGSVNYDFGYLVGHGWSTSDSGVTFVKTGTYGTATLTVASNVVSYALNNNSATTQALTQGQTVNDSFTIQVVDNGGATASVNAVFGITGSNDVPTISGSTSGNVTEDGTQTASGTLTVTDVDSGQSAAQVVTAGTH